MLIGNRELTWILSSDLGIEDPVDDKPDNKARASWAYVLVSPTYVRRVVVDGSQIGVSVETSCSVIRRDKRRLRSHVLRMIIRVNMTRRS